MLKFDCVAIHRNVNLFAPRLKRKNGFKIQKGIVIPTFSDGNVKKMSEVPHDSSICGARSRTNKHQPCRRIAMVNGRCHLHGGKSTGSKTPEGKLIQKMASWKHGMRSKEAMAEAKTVRQMIHAYREELK